DVRTGPPSAGWQAATERRAMEGEERGRQPMTGPYPLPKIHRDLVPADTYPPATRGEVIVWGFLAAYPFGGMTWQVLQHLVGLRRLGFDVWYVEESDSPVYDASTYWQVYDV